MAVKLNDDALEFAKKLVKEGKVKKDERDDWSQDASSTDKQNKFIEENGMDEYSKWFLGINTDEDKENKGAYEFPYGDFKEVHRGGIIAAKVRAAQYDHSDIEKGANEILEMIDNN